MQFSILMAIPMVFGAAVVIAQPYRIPLLHVTRITSLLTLAAAIASSLMLSTSTNVNGQATARGVLLAASVVLTVLSVLQSLHMVVLKVFEMRAWADDGRTHIWLDGGCMEQHVDDGFSERVMALLPPSEYFQPSHIVPGKPGKVEL